MVKDELRSLRTQFPNQTSQGFWTLVSATLKAPMHPLPDYPGVLLLLSTPASHDTANCLASRLVEISSKVLARPGLLPPPPQSLILPSSSLPKDPAEAKQHLTDKLHAALGSGSAAALLDLQQIDSLAALTLHAFADNTNAPFKQAWRSILILKSILILAILILKSIFILTMLTLKSILITLAMLILRSILMLAHTGSASVNPGGRAGRL